LPDFPWSNLPKLEKYNRRQRNIPKGNNIHIPDNFEVYRMAVKCTKNFHSKAFQNIPKLEFCYATRYVNHLATLFATLDRQPKKLKLNFLQGTYVQEKHILGSFIFLSIFCDVSQNCILST
jgi:hypothetical protein